VHFQLRIETPLRLKKITTEDGKRVYVTPEGKSYESVTTFLDRTFAKPQLVAWRKRIGTVKASKITNTAAKRGKSLHTAIETYLLNGVLDLSDSPNTKSLFVKVLPLLDRFNNHRIMESPLYSDALELAGTPDYIGDFDNELSVADFKTNSFANKTRFELIPYFLQCGCYAQMFYELYGAMPQKAVIIITSPNAAKGILQTLPMDLCLGMLERFRRDPVAFQASIPIKVIGQPNDALRAS